MIKYTRKSKRLPISYISVAKLQKHLNTKVIGQVIKYMTTVDSTNEEAKRNSAYPEGALFIAETQTNGKGRLGRMWDSEPNTGIYMSLILKPDIEPEKLSQITLLAGIAICRALSCGSLIKWPNDIIIGSKKVCGILTEMIAAPDGLNCVVCGIGINVNTSVFPIELKDKATSLLIETCKEHSREKIIADFINEFELLYAEFIRNGFSSILNEYRSLCATLNREVRITDRNRTITAKAIDIDEIGRLVVETENEKISVSSGEVSVRGLLGYV